MLSYTGSRRKLWTMACESIFQNMAASFSRPMLEKLFTKYDLAFPEGKYGQVAIYQEAHKRCHHDTPFSRHVQRYLHHKHVQIIKRVATMNPELVRLTIEAMLIADDMTQAEDVAGFLWAICSDPRPELRAVEQAFVEELHLLSHGLLLAQFQREAGRPRADHAAADVPHASLEQEVQQLSAACRTLTTAHQSLEQQRDQLAQENERLQQTLKALTQRYHILQQQGSPVSSARQQDRQARELRKMQYQVDKLSACVQEKDAENQRLVALVESPTASPGELPPEAAEPACSTWSAKPPAAPTLHGKTVAFIGGMGKASPHYEHVIQELGACCLYHDGDLRRGRKRLAEIIKQADIVFCPVDCNSHGAATSTKKLCKAMHKPCYFLRSSGITHVREKLLEIAQTGAPSNSAHRQVLVAPCAPA